MASGAIVVSYAALRDARLARVDRALTEAIARGRGPVADRVVASTTDLGSLYAVAGLAAVLAASGRVRLARDAVGAGLTGWVAAQAVKPLVDRPRPYQADGSDRLVFEPAGSSWPSGHPAVVAAVATVLAPELPRGGRGVAAALAGFVAASRVYVGVHYASDVVAGLGLGVLCGRLWRGVVRCRRR